MAEFLFTIAPESEKELNPRMLSLGFGDGYVQEQPDGINALPIAWNLKFVNVDVPTALAIEAFFKARVTNNGFEPFLWQDPDADTHYYICRSWKVSYTASPIRQITCRFEQWFGAV